jgi:hypothetical protein
MLKIIVSVICHVFSYKIHKLRTSIFYTITVHPTLILHLSRPIFLTCILPLLKKALNVCLNHLLLTVMLILFLLHLSNNMLMSVFLPSPYHSSFVVFWCFPGHFENCSFHPLLRKPNLDKENLGNCHPVSHLNFLSKLTEKIVKCCLVDHVSKNDLLNSFQSAYVESHSTETTLFSVHDYIIRTMSLDNSLVFVFLIFQLLMTP